MQLLSNRQQWKSLSRLPVLGPYLASGAIDFLTGACVVASLQLAQSALFPPARRIGKLGNDHVPQGVVRRK